MSVGKSSLKRAAGKAESAEKETKTVKAPAKKTAKETKPAAKKPAAKKTAPKKAEATKAVTAAKKLAEKKAEPVQEQRQLIPAPDFSRVKSGLICEIPTYLL